MARTKKTIIICYILLLGWMTFIFIMSDQTSQESSEISGGIVSKFIAAFYKNFDELTTERQLEITEIITVVVRKLAHFLEYFVLGILAFCSTLSYSKYQHKTKVIYAILLCVLYAVSDEIHQYFVPGRACRALDVGIDAAGSIIAISLVAAIVFLKKDKNRVKSMRKKKLIEQNLSLFESLQKTQRELSELKKVFDQNMQEIKSLKSQLEEAKETQNDAVVTEPLRRLEEKVITNATLKPDMEYGAKVIGKIVVSAAEYSNKLTMGGTDKHRELVNLILGKTEIAKAEILSVIETNDTLDIKCLKIDQISADSQEYFESVAAQII